MKFLPITQKKESLFRTWTVFLFMATSIICLPISLSGQIDTVWVRRFNGSGDSTDICHALAVDNQGNVYVTGESWAFGSFEDYTTIKYDSSGTEQWVRNYGPVGGGVDCAFALVLDNQGNIYVTGESVGLSSVHDYATIKYNPAGIEQWISRYNGPGNNFDEAYAIAVDNWGNVYVTGRSYGSNNNDDYATIKYDSSGVEQWVARYNGSGNGWDLANDIVVDNVGNVYVTGGSPGAGTDRDCTTIKYSPEGLEQWVARYNGTDNGRDEAYAITVDNQSNVYVTGRSYSFATDYDYVTVKYDSNGVEQWVAKYNGSVDWHDGASSIAVDNLDNVYVTGSSMATGSGYDYATIKYDSSGVEQWVARYNGPAGNWDLAHDLTIDSTGNIYVIGGSIGSGTDYDYATIKYDFNGVEQWVVRYNGSGNSLDEAYALAVDNQDNVYVAGRSYGSGAYADYVTIKYDQTPGISEETMTRIEKYHYASTIVSGSLLLPKDKNCEVFDITGREVAPDKIKPGVYFIEIDGEITQKVVKVR